MAKKKTEETVEIGLEDFAMRVRNQVTKLYGKGVCITGQEVLDRKIEIVPWCMSLNMSLGGGIEEGCWVSLSGAEKCGKTSIFLSLAANAQKMGKMIYFLNVEGRFKKRNITGIEGLDISDDKFLVFESTPQKTLSTQDYLNIMEIIIRDHPGSVIIIDSLSALADDKELVGGLGTQTRGHNQQVITQFINNNAQLVPANKIIILGIVQLMANTSGFGAAIQEKGAKRWFYQADVLLRVKNYDKWRVGNAETGKIVGHILHIEIKTSSLGQPYASCDTYLRFGTSVDNIYELLTFATSCNLIRVSGSWYYMQFLENNPELWGGDEIPKFQGGENVYEYLKQNKNILEMLEKEIMGYSGVLEN